MFWVSEVRYGYSPVDSIEQRMHTFESSQRDRPLSAASAKTWDPSTNRSRCCGTTAMFACVCVCLCVQYAWVGDNGWGGLKDALLGLALGFRTGGQAGRQAEGWAGLDGPSIDLLNNQSSPSRMLPPNPLSQSKSTGI